MARIPLAENFGNRSAPAENTPRGDLSGGPVAGAVGRLGEVVVGESQRWQAKFEQERRDAERVQAATAVATYQNAAYAAHDEVALGVSNGSIPTNEARSELEMRLGKAREPLGQLPRDVVGMANVHAVGVDGQLQRGLNGVIIKRQQSEAGASIDQFGEETARIAVREKDPAKAVGQFASALDLAGPTAGLTPEAIAKKKQAFTESTHYAVFDAEGVDLLTKSDADGLGKLLKRVDGKDGDPLDPMKRTQLKHQLYGWQQSLKAKEAADAESAFRAQEARESEAERAYGEAVDLTMKGRYLDPQYIKLLTVKAQGTRAEGAVGELFSSQSDVAGFATRSAAERTAVLEKERSRGSTPGVGTSPGREKTFGAMVKIDAELTNAAKSNPWEAAQSAGVIPRAPVLDASNAGGTLGVIQQRQADQAKVEAWAGHPISPLQPEEANVFAEYVQRLPPDARSRALAQVSSGLTLGRLEALADQIDKKDKPLSLALKLGADTTSAGRPTGELVLRGAQALKDKGVQADSAAVTGWRSEISNLVRGTLGDQKAEDDAVDAAFYIRAAMDSDQSLAPGFKFGKTAEAAVKLALGQPLERGGVKTVLPKGMDEDAFDDRLRTFTPDKLKLLAPEGQVFVRGVPVPLERLSGGLRSMGMRRDGRGNFVPSSGGAFVTLDQAGQLPLRLPMQ